MAGERAPKAIGWKEEIAYIDVRPTLASYRELENLPHNQVPKGKDYSCYSVYSALTDKERRALSELPHLDMKFLIVPIRPAGYALRDSPRSFSSDIDSPIKERGLLALS